MAAEAFIQGFGLALTLILAIGAQNAFVLRQGLRREHVLAVVLICAVSDAVLISVGVFAFAAAERVMPAVVPLLRWGGAAFLLAYGALSFRNAWRGGEALEAGAGGPRALRPVALTCLALTWLNPHVYLDTVALIGSVSTAFPEARLAFTVGAASASFAFFFALGYGARLLQPIFARPLSWRVLDVAVGCVMWAIAAGLVLG
ncbi:LysE/ArgO family amino acid transporter [Tropicimonas isoalkanivorans]|uniref:L-lysine exporter family protein LysE/ArgO n=1 Tax=Tropicimonas isoalkanivorans TaxID=441112 RepID=A0A1I1NIW1_9RHOB|nr:LysE/ArgO family amino acid transporter [Tropicimonas isoalkanivorans]SFC97477.1 L-lysine exporter family protein LysE/ArgO [Tropicimonas isoalkanivorans]